MWNYPAPANPTVLSSLRAKRGLPADDTAQGGQPTIDVAPNDHRDADLAKALVGNATGGAAPSTGFETLGRLAEVYAGNKADARYRAANNLPPVKRGIFG